MVKRLNNQGVKMQKKATLARAKEIEAEITNKTNALNDVLADAAEAGFNINITALDFATLGQRFPRKFIKIDPSVNLSDLG